MSHENSSPGRRKLPIKHTNISITDHFAPLRPSKETYRTNTTDTMSQTIAPTDAEAQKAFPFAEPKGWYTECENVGGHGDPWCFKEKCSNHKQPQRWHWRRTEWTTVMEWLKEQDLGTPWNEIDWKLEHESPELDAKLFISVKATSLGTATHIYVRCTQSAKDSKDRANFLDVKLVHDSKDGRYRFMDQHFVVHATLKPGCARADMLALPSPTSASVKQPIAISWCMTFKYYCAFTIAGLLMPLTMEQSFFLFHFRPMRLPLFEHQPPNYYQPPARKPARYQVIGFHQHPHHKIIRVAAEARGVDDILKLGGNELGYHVIINRGADDHGEEGNAFAAPQERETISLEHPWNSPPEVRIGTSSLRERLENTFRLITDFHNSVRMYFFESEIRNNPQNK
ncbi:hypothetical protein LY76DRAFT_636384 [Colletotrichum caudatum]|nr:hypothetical protein LY76DRAFT_636384 [Colletotrichum caudatum]